MKHPIPPFFSGDAFQEYQESGGGVHLLRLKEFSSRWLERFKNTVVMLGDAAIMLFSPPSS
jgi:hypothetical protein